MGVGATSMCHMHAAQSHICASDADAVVHPREQRKVSPAEAQETSPGFA